MKLTNEEMAVTAADTMNNLQKILTDLEGVEEYREYYETFKEMYDNFKYEKEKYENKFKEQMQERFKNEYGIDI